MVGTFDLRYGKESQFVVCIESNSYSASLEFGKIYRVVDDKRAAQHPMLRIIDESGEDYLYPERLFVLVALSSKTRQALFEQA
jgi:hypothetical protein